MGKRRLPPHNSQPLSQLGWECVLRLRDRLRDFTFKCSDNDTHRVCERQIGTHMDLGWTKPTSSGRFDAIF